MVILASDRDSGLKPVILKRGPPYSARIIVPDSSSFGALSRPAVSKGAKASS